MSPSEYSALVQRERKANAAHRRALGRYDRGEIPLAKVVETFRVWVSIALDMRVATQTKGDATG